MYTLEDLFQSINDIYYQYDEGKMTLEQSNKLASYCCERYLNDLRKDNCE